MTIISTMVESDLVRPESKISPLSDEEANEKAKVWLKTKVISTQEIATIWVKGLPFYEKLPLERQKVIDRRLAIANRYFSSVEESILKEIEVLDPEKPAYLDSFLSNENLEGEAERVYRIAACLTLFRLYANLYRLTKDPEMKTSLKTNLTYFGALHDFFAGTKSGCFEFMSFLSFAKLLPFDLIERSEPTKEFSDKLLSMVFPGHTEDLDHRS